MGNLLIGLVMIAAGVLCLLLCLLLYLLPSGIAFNRGHDYRWPIFAINLFTGWSLIGWIIALVWSILPKGKLS